MQPTITVSRREGRDHLPHEVFLTASDSAVSSFRDTVLIAAFEDEGDALAFAARKATEHRAVVVVESHALTEHERIFPRPGRAA